jgi:hypothetical protein
MALRHLLEYEDHEISDLLGDLETVGHADKRSFALWVSVPRYYFVGSVESMPALGHPFYSSGSLELDKPSILEALKQGKFTGLGKDSQGLHKEEPGIQRIQEVIEFLESRSLIQFFSGQRSLDESLMNLKTRLSEIVQNDQKDPTVGIVYGRPGDRDLEIKPLSSFRRASFDNRGGIFYEDLEDNSDNHWTFPFA